MVEENKPSCHKGMGRIDKSELPGKLDFWCFGGTPGFISYKSISNGLNGLMESGFSRDTWTVG